MITWIVLAVLSLIFGSLLLRLRYEVEALQMRLVQVELEVAALIHGKKEKNTKSNKPKGKDTLRDGR